MLDTYTGYGICDAVYRPDFVAEDCGGILLGVGLEVDDDILGPQDLVDHGSWDGLELLENRAGPGRFDVYEYIGVYDSGGNLISGTTSASTGKRISVSFEPVSNGTYYIAVGSGSRARLGVYKLKIEEAA